MTYQATRPAAVPYERGVYGNGLTQRNNVNNNYRPVKNAVAPERKRAKALTKEEMLCIRDAEIRRRRREAAEAARGDARIRQAKRDISRTKAYESEIKREQHISERAEKAKRREKARLEAESALRHEIKVPRQKMPWQFILCVAIIYTSDGDGFQLCSDI